MGQVLGIVYRAISGTLLKKAGLNRKEGITGAVTLIQRFGGAVNLNIHFHMLFVDGVYSRNRYGKVVFHRTKAPDREELHKLLNTTSHRVASYLVRQGLLEIDEENGSWTSCSNGRDSTSPGCGRRFSSRHCSVPTIGKISVRSTRRSTGPRARQCPTTGPLSRYGGTTSTVSGKPGEACAWASGRALRRQSAPRHNAPRRQASPRRIVA